MRWRFLGPAVWLSLALAGCGGEGVPPLDELPLRDALRADPEVIAALPAPARARLAARLEAARSDDVATDDVADDGRAPAALVAAADQARERRIGEPLVVGALGGGVARPVRDRASPGGGPPLPPLDGDDGGPTASLERAALDGDAGLSVRALLQATGAGRLQRVTGWPAGAVAIGDRVYVNAAWLVAMAPAAGGSADGGAGAPGSGEQAPGALPAAPVVGTAGPPANGEVPPPVATPAPSSAARSQAADLPQGYDPDAGTEPPPPDTSPSFWDACSSCADACTTSSAACDDSSGDSCDSTSDDGSGDSCNGNSGDGSGDSTDSCNNTDTTSDGGGGSCDSSGGGDDAGASCQVARGRGRGHPGTVAWLLAPLGFLLTRSSRGGSRQ